MPRKKKQEKKEENKEEKPVVDNRIEEKNQEKQTKFVILFMVGLIVAIILVYFLFQIISVKMNSFEYKNVKYQKVKQGELNFYVGTFPVYDIYGNIAKSFKVYFYEDPRKLENISEEPVLALKRINVVDLEDLYSSECEDSSVAGGILLGFLKNFYGDGMNTFQGSLNKTKAEQLNIEYVNCTDSRYSVIKLKTGFESRIIKTGECYILEAGNNCEINNVTEKFLIELYDDSYNPDS